jgi:tRNA nucleotidyltransferase/poly(A) polymerase
MPRRLPHAGPPASGGEWRALSGEGPVGRGLTADEARTTANLSRSKELTQVTYFPDDMAEGLELPAVFERVCAALPNPSRTFLVGGAVRDALLSRPLHDFDFAVSGDGLAAARAVARALDMPFYALDDSRGTGRVIFSEGTELIHLDFASLRGTDLNADLAARDFTINAIALSADKQFIDPMGGQADLRSKVLRACGPASITDDPVRSLRLIRFAAQLNFRIERGTREAARSAASLLATTSAERIRDEFFKMLGGRRVAACIRAMDALGLLVQVLPETATLKGVTQSHPHIHDVWEHTLAVIDALDRLLGVLGRTHNVDAASEYVLGYAAGRAGRYRDDLADHLETQLSEGRSVRSLLFFAAIMHDIAKPQTRSVEAEGRIRFLGHELAGESAVRARGIALKLAGNEVDRVAAVVRHHMRPVVLSQGEAITPRAIYRFFRDTGPAGIDICLLTLADMMGMRGIEIGQTEWATRVNATVTLLEGYYRQPEQVVRPPALINGEDVMTAGVPQGKRVGELLEAVREAQVEGKVTSRDDALALVKELIKKNPSMDLSD